LLPPLLPQALQPFPVLNPRHALLHCANPGVLLGPDNNPATVSYMHTLFRLSIVPLVCMLFACAEQGDGTPAGDSAHYTDPHAPNSASSSTADQERSSQLLHQLFEDYFQSNLELNPTFATFIGDNRYNDAFANDISPEW